MAPATEIVVDKGLVGLIWIIGLGAIAVTGSLIAFDLLRPRIPDVFDRRRKILPENVLGFAVDDGRHDTPSAPSLRPFAWIRHTLRISDTDIVTSHGSDTVMLLRFYRTLAQLTGLLSLYVCIVLFPTYGTGPNKDLPKSNPLRIIGVRILSLANVPKKNWRHVVTFISDLIISLTVLRKLALEVRFLASVRRDYRTSEHPSNYTLIVQDVPEGIQNNEDLHKFWHSLFSETLCSVKFVPQASKLEKYREDYWRAVRYRQRAQILAKNPSLRHRVLEKVKQPINLLSKASSLEDRNEDQPMDEFSRHASRSEETVITEASLNTIELEKGGYVEKSNSENRYHLPGQYFSSEQIKQVASIVNPVDPLQHWMNPQASLNHWSQKEQEARNKFQSYLGNFDEEEKGNSSRAAIVVMRSKQAATMISQTNFSRKRNEWAVSHAPDADAINWDAFKITARTMLIRKLISLGLTSTLIVFWVIPTAFIQSLANLEEISKSPAFAWLRFVNRAGPEISGFIQGLMPALILELVMIIVPKLIRRIVMLMRIPSKVDIEREVLAKMIAFLYFSHLVYVVLSGSLLEYSDEIISNPSNIVNIMATSIPQQGTFMMTVVLLAAVVQVPIAIIQPTRLFKRWLGMRRALTSRDRELVDNDQSVTDHFEQYAIGTIFTVLGLVYSTLSPLLLIFVTLFFMGSYVVEKYKLVYTHTKEWEGFAALHYTAIQGIAFGLIVKHVTMTGLMGLNGHATLATLEFITALILCVSIIWYGRHMAPILEHGALADLADVDTDDQLTRGISGASSATTKLSFEEASDAYEHPGLAPLGIPAEQKDGNV